MALFESYDRRIEKINAALNANGINDIEEAKVEMEKKDKRIKNGIAIGTTVATLGATIWATKFSWIKEEGGHMTFTAGRKAMDSLLNFVKRH